MSERVCAYCAMYKLMVCMMNVHMQYEAAAAEESDLLTMSSHKSCVKRVTEKPYYMVPFTEGCC